MEYSDNLWLTGLFYRICIGRALEEEHLHGQEARHASGHDWGGRCHYALSLSLGMSDKWVLPPTDQAGRLDSLREQAKTQTATVGLDLSPVLNEVEEKLLRSDFKLPSNRGGSEWMSRFARGFEETSAGWTDLWRRGNKSCTGGRSRRWPRPRASSWAGLWEYHARDIASLVYGRLIMRFAYLDKLPSMSPMEKVRAGLCDPKQIFTKPEPHPLLKAMARRWRGIWGMSMVDVICQAATTDPIDKHTIDLFQKGEQDNMAAGMGHHDHGVERIGLAIERLFPDGEVHQADVTGWDLSVPPAQLVLDGNIRATAYLRHDKTGLALGAMPDTFAHLGHVLWIDNVLFASHVYGQVPSGWLKTTSCNNYLRNAGLRLSKAGEVISTGDDALW